ncbi:MAG: hypothetical protein GF313_11065 [Caldithrix sp.]|nr:hypothetical protein [Caldithrix sp.]
MILKNLNQIIVIVMLSTAVIFAQNSDAQNGGTSGAATVLSRGIESLYWNPANVGLQRDNMIEVNLISVNVLAGNNAFSISSYNRYFTEEGNNNYWSDGDKKDLLSLIPDDGLVMGVDYGGNILGIAVKNFGFTAQFIGSGSFEMFENKKLLNIALFGETVDNQYTFQDDNFIKGQSFTALKFTGAYAYPVNIDRWIDIPDLSEIMVGAGLHYYLGGAYGKVKHSAVNLQRFGEGDDARVAYKAHLEGKTAGMSDDRDTFVGSGFGLDLGFNTQYKEKWQFALSFSNLFASINWNGNTELQRSLVADTLLFEDLPDNDEDPSVETDTTYNIGRFSSSLPTTMRLGASYRLMPGLTLAAEWHQGMDNDFRNSTTPKLVFGGVYTPLKWLPLRTGMSFGGREGFVFALGSGLNFSHFAMDISYAMHNALWPTSAEGILAAFGMKLKF